MKERPAWTVRELGKIFGRRIVVYSAINSEIGDNRIGDATPQVNQRSKRSAKSITVVEMSVTENKRRFRHRSHQLWHFKILSETNNVKGFHRKRFNWLKSLNFLIFRNVND